MGKKAKKAGTAVWTEGEWLAVRWLDSCSFGASGSVWQAGDDIRKSGEEYDAAVIKSVGVLVGETANSIVLAQNATDCGDVLNVFSIPKGCIICAEEISWD